MERFKISSNVDASANEAWQWITSVKGISAELSPYMRMSFPESVVALTDLKIEYGKPLFRSKIYLFGILPVDYSDLTLIELNDSVGFVEQSAMGSMRQWRHERTIRTLGSGCEITDLLTFEPRFAPRLSAWFIEMLFKHRHTVIRSKLRSSG